MSLSLPAQTGNKLNVSRLKDQNDTDIISQIDRQKAYIKELYAGKIEAQKELINGKEYEPYYTRSKIKPLLFTEKPRTASIITGTRRYNNLTLQYDTFLDEMVYTDTSRTINYRFPQIALNKDIIEEIRLYFSDDSLIFKYFRKPDCTSRNLEEGFYEVVYEGKSSYIIKHTSSFYERQGLNEYKYSPKNFIRTGDKYFRIKSKGSLLRLFGERSGEVKSFLHLSRIRMKQVDKSGLVSILKYYDSLTTSPK